mmetsp:Transcript_119826/g.335551  ORF Transcript_119826/g.335551 Transcript_119826/m.335551 type:complete len:238 (+) Transcript_119826:1021-1734(+)
MKWPVVELPGGPVPTFVLRRGRCVATLRLLGVRLGLPIQLANLAPLALGAVVVGVGHVDRLHAHQVRAGEVVHLACRVAPRGERGPDVAQVAGVARQEGAEGEEQGAFEEGHADPVGECALPLPLLDRRVPVAPTAFLLLKGHCVQLPGDAFGTPPAPTQVALPVRLVLLGEAHVVDAVHEVRQLLDAPSGLAGHGRSLPDAVGPSSQRGRRHRQHRMRATTGRRPRGGRRERRDGA